MRIILFHGARINILNLDLFPNRAPTELSQIAFLKSVLRVGVRTDFAQEERLGLPYWIVI